jgi:hypothetical protein
LSTYGPAVRTAWRQLHAAKKQLKTDLQATPPVGPTLVADAAAVAAAKAQLKGARDQLNGALNAALTPSHLQQLQAQLAAQSQNRLDAKTGHILLQYVRYIEKQ